MVFDYIVCDENNKRDDMHRLRKSGGRREGTDFGYFAMLTIMRMFAIL